MKNARFALTTALSLVIFSHQAKAQDAAPPSPLPTTAEEQSEGLSDIVVTARKREERLQDVPVAITAISGADIERKSQLNTVSLSGDLPSLYIKQNPTTTVSSSIYIRGVGQEDSQFTQEPGVATYIDGVYYSRSSGSILELVDVERIEVLRGPQGTLFGRNSPAGAISIVTQAPNLNANHVKLDATVGNFNQRAIRGSGNVVLVDGVLAMKVDFMARSEDGFMRNLSPSINKGLRPEILNGVDKQAGRVSLLLTPSDRLRMRLIGDVQRDRSTAYAPSFATTNPDGTISYGAGGPHTTYAEPQFSLPAVFDGYGISLTDDYDLNDAFAVKMITGYRWFHHFLAGELVGIPQVSVGLQRDQNSYMLQQEGQLNYTSGRFKAVTGLIYFRDLTKERAYNAFTAGVNNGSNLYPVSKQTTDSYAAYAEGTFDVTEFLSLTAGGRYSEDKKRMVRKTTNLPDLAGTFVGYNVDKSVTFSKFTPRVIASINPLKALDAEGGSFLSSLMVYASWAKGYKSGAFDAAYTLGQAGATSILQPEFTTTYEGGFKSDLFNRRVRLNVTYFDTKYSNLQTLDCQFASNICTGLTQDVKLRGFEFEGQSRLVRDLNVSFSAATLDSKYTKPTTSLRLQNTPKFTYAIGGEYRTTLGSQSSLFANAHWRHSSDFYANTRSSPETTIRAYGLLDASIGYSSPDDRWTIRLVGMNLLNKFYVANIVDAGIGAAGHFIGRPREVNVTVGFKY